MRGSTEREEVKTPMSFHYKKGVPSFDKYCGLVTHCLSDFTMINFGRHRATILTRYC